MQSSRRGHEIKEACFPRCDRAVLLHPASGQGETHLLPDAMENLHHIGMNMIIVSVLLAKLAVVLVQ